MMLEQTIFEYLERRIGQEHLGNRLRMQVDHSARYFSRGHGGFHWENIEFISWAMRKILMITGLLGRGQRNTMEYRVVEVEVLLPNLAQTHEGLGILHLSDIHADALIDQGERLSSLINSLHFDLCVITGDFRFLTFGDYERAMRSMQHLLTSIRCEYGVVGVLGNHDFIETVPFLENCGVRILINEHMPIICGDAASIWLLGVDDPHFYGLDDLPLALAGLPESALKILLVHSPEIIPEAAEAGIDYYLCGHTHGGQVCLPGGMPILTNASCARKYTAGPWRYDGMLGYTSRGTGSSGLPVRFFCPPEITLHRFYRGPPI
jgi:uncharacterized protein